MAAPHTLWMGLVLLGVLQTQAEAQVSLQPNFQQDKFLGRWFTSGLASNSSWFLEKKAALSMYPLVVTPAPTGDGTLNLTTTFLRKDQCETRSLLLRPAGPPGFYSYTSFHWGSTQDVWVVDTNYEGYALLYTSGTKEQSFHMATLYSRTQNPTDEVKEKFATFAKAQGFQEDSIVFLPKTDRCMEVHQ